MATMVNKSVKQGLGIIFRCNDKEWQLLPNCFPTVEIADFKRRKKHKEGDWTESRVVPVVRTIEVHDSVRHELLSKISP